MLLGFFVVDANYCFNYCKHWLEITFKLNKLINKNTWEEINGNKHLRLAPTNEGKEKTKNSGEMGIKTRYLIGSITENLDDFDEKYIKIKFNSDDELTLNKMIKIIE